ncbi:hypothetical protein QBC38DRAFT_408061 [Podospora fimiseda]|uniref:Uncharacterized protein n=1 Tax=Podospora fimiseda TaxID=252190 RepID=A0AAN7BYS3_9PEZI|nr:hypothetical protein QBC38DRAFT_408061 [Podospora fimiseda]
MYLNNNNHQLPLWQPPEPQKENNKLDIAQTILTALSLIGVVAAVVALTSERIRRIRELDRGHEATKPAFLGPFTTESVNCWYTLLGRQTSLIELPTIRGLIEAADQNYWTSRTLDHMDGLHPDLTWLPLYESIFDDLRHPDLSELPEIWTKNPILARVFEKLASVTEEKEKHHDPALSNKHRHLIKEQQLKSGIRRLPQRKQPPPVKEGEGLARLKPAWMIGKRPCILVTREELAAMSLIMGMPIKQDAAGFYSGIGAYGLSIDIAHADAGWKLSLFKGPRIPRHAASMGSGYTSLMAKHLACGSIPFDELKGCIRSVYITKDVLDSIKKGLCIKDTQAYGGQSLEFLRRLPGEKAVDAYYAVATAAESQDSDCILNGKGSIAGSWARLITGIAFGGLVPQADHNVIEAVKFTVAGTNLDGCVQELEPLIDCLHKAAQTDLNIFGERVASRNNDEYGLMYVNHIFPSADKNPRDAASTFARYMNLLEHVLAMIKPPVGAATTAPAATANRNIPALTDKEKKLLETDYGQILKNITEEQESQNVELSLDQAADIVRCILGAWAHTVPEIDVMASLKMDDLPAVVALG